VTVALGRWAERAECIRYPADWWHSDDSFERERAASVCADCPVQRECLDYAQRWQQRRNGCGDQPYGIWSGWLFRYGEKPAPVGAPRMSLPPPEPRLLDPCGTEGAYQRHRRYGETPCPPCVAANVESCRAYRQRRAEAKRRRAS